MDSNSKSKWIEARLRAAAGELLGGMGARSVAKLVAATGTEVLDGQCACAVQRKRHGGTEHESTRCAHCSAEFGDVVGLGANTPSAPWRIILGHRAQRHEDAAIALGCARGHLRRLGLEGPPPGRWTALDEHEAQRRARRLVELVLGPQHAASDLRVGA